jgi:Zn-dependent alcohol dehydrogenase
MGCPSLVFGALAAKDLYGFTMNLLDDKLKVVQEVGTSQALNAANENPVETIRETTKGGALNCFDGAARECVLVQAYGATGRGATTIGMGLCISARSLVAEERKICGSYMWSAVPHRDMPHFINMYLAALLPVEKLHIHELSLEEVNSGFDRLAKAEAVRQLIRF